MLPIYFEAIFFGLIAYGILLIIGTVQDWKCWQSAKDTSIEGIDLPIRLTEDEDITINHCGTIKNRWVVSTGAIDQLTDEHILTLIRRSKMLNTKLYDYIKNLILVLPIPLSILIQPVYPFNIAELLLSLIGYYFVIGPAINRLLVYHLDRTAIDRGIDLLPALRIISEHSGSRNAVQRAYMPSYERRISKLKNTR